MGAGSGDDEHEWHEPLDAPFAAGLVGVPVRASVSRVQRLHDALRTADGAARGPVLLALAGQQHTELEVDDVSSMVAEAARLGEQFDDADLRHLVFSAETALLRASSASYARQSIDTRLLNTQPGSRAESTLLHLGAGAALRVGDLATADTYADRMAHRGNEGDTVLEWTALRTKAALQLARGSIEPARQTALAAVRLAVDTPFDAEATDHFGLAIVAILRERNKLLDAAPTVDTWVEESPTHGLFRAMRALNRAQLGDPAGARSDLEIFFAAADGSSVGDQRDGLIAAAFAAVTASKLDSHDALEWQRRSHGALAPHSHAWLVAGDLTVIEGPVPRVLALLSSAMGQHEQAQHENDLARDAAQRAGAAMFTWRSLEDRGDILARAGHPGDARDALHEAAARYRSAGLTRRADAIDARAAALRSPTVGSAAEQTPTARFERIDKQWHVGLGNESGTVSHRKGMSMLAALVDSPGVEVAALTLSAVGESRSRTPGDGLSTTTRQELIDDTAAEAYKRRLDEIVLELDRADRRGDRDASERLSSEFDAITQELARVHGIGDRRRTMSDEAERARVRVTKSIRAAIASVGEVAPALSDHLNRAVVTGRMCRYDPDTPVDWQR